MLKFSLTDCLLIFLADKHSLVSEWVDAPDSKYGGSDVGGVQDRYIVQECVTSTANRDKRNI